MERNLKSVAQFATDSPFTSGQIRWWLFNAANNGLAAQQACIRIGRRVYIDTIAFDRWVSAQNPKGQAA